MGDAAPEWRHRLRGCDRAQQEIAAHLEVPAQCLFGKTTRTGAAAPATAATEVAGRLLS